MGVEGAWLSRRKPTSDSLGDTAEGGGCDYHFLSGVGVGNLGTIVLVGREATVQAEALNWRLTFVVSTPFPTSPLPLPALCLYWRAG